MEMRAKQFINQIYLINFVKRHWATQMVTLLDKENSLLDRVRDRNTLLGKEAGNLNP